MRFKVTTLAFLILVANLSLTARGHFVWMDVVEKGSSGPQVEVYFSETADPGEPHLIEKIAGTKVWARTATGDAGQAVQLKEVRDELAGKLTGRAPDGKSYSLEAVCDYGVVEKGGQAFLLKYYAKHIQRDAIQSPRSVGDQHLAPLDIQIAPAAAGFTCSVAWNGKPLKNAALSIYFPAGDALERKTNDLGQVEVATKTKGRFAVLARHVEPGEGGELNGKKYSEVRHYATLTASLAAGATGSALDAASAAELLRSARDARAVWDKFPGFSADLAVQFNEGKATGKVTISAEGDVILKMPQFAGSEWLQTYLESVVQHRMPGDPESENVRYAGDADGHPLGRKIALGDGKQDSVYRIGGNVVREVNRRAGPGRFTISVLEVERNREGRYLPAFYTMTFWNAAGKVASTSTTQDSWVRVGRFDLPLRTLQVTTADDRHEVKQLDFSNHALLTPAASSE